MHVYVIKTVLRTELTASRMSCRQTTRLVLITWLMHSTESAAFVVVSKYPHLPKAEHSTARRDKTTL